MFVQRPYMPGSSDLDQAQRIFAIFGRPWDYKFYRDYDAINLERHKRHNPNSQDPPPLGVEGVSVASFSGAKRTIKEFTRYGLSETVSGMVANAHIPKKIRPQAPGCLCRLHDQTHVHRSHAAHLSRRSSRSRLVLDRTSACKGWRVCFCLTQFFTCFGRPRLTLLLLLLRRQKERMESKQGNGPQAGARQPCTERADADDACATAPSQASTSSFCFEGSGTPTAWLPPAPRLRWCWGRRTTTAAFWLCQRRPCRRAFSPRIRLFRRQAQQSTASNGPKVIRIARYTYIRLDMHTCRPHLA